jgi:hypothetical protein
MFAWALAVLTCLSPRGLSQVSLNPDISVIPLFRLQTDDEGSSTTGTRKFDSPEFSFEELEIIAGAYINPYARADVVLAIPGPDLENLSLELEEAYLTVLRGLPLDINVRLGKYRVDWGKINMVHPHAWPFISQPTSQARFIGEEGLNDLGLSMSLLLPTGGLYSKLTVDVLKGSSVAEAAGMEDTTGGTLAPAWSGRLMTFLPLGDDSDLELGVSGLTGIHDPFVELRFWYVNGDLKFKYKPSSYTSLTLQGEFLYNTRKLNAEPGGNSATTMNSAGLYAYLDYQFLKIYSVGTRFDWSQSPYSDSEKSYGGALFLGYYPFEETLGIRLQYQYDRLTEPDSRQTVNTIGLQVLFSLGPHKAHPF